MDTFRAVDQADRHTDQQRQNEAEAERQVHLVAREEDTGHDGHEAEARTDGEVNAGGRDDERRTERHDARVGRLQDDAQVDLTVDEREVGHCKAKECQNDQQRQCDQQQLHVVLHEGLRKATAPPGPCYRRRRCSRVYSVRFLLADGGQFHDVFLGGFLMSRGADDAAVGHDGDAVRQAQDLRQLRGDDDDRLSLLCQFSSSV